LTFGFALRRASRKGELWGQTRGQVRAPEKSARVRQCAVLEVVRSNEGPSRMAVLLWATLTLMNARIFTLMAAGLSVVASALAATNEAYVPIKVIQTEPVIYPRRASDMGIVSGEARIAVQIDEKGQMADHLVVGYSHEAFAEAAIAAIKKWRFEPARLQGQPRGAITELSFSFESKGLIVVDLSVSSYVQLRDYSLRPGAYAYGVRRLRELDRIPTPTAVVRPAYPIEPSQPPRAANVVVNFYIDEKGKVRMPTVSRETSQSDEIFAVTAVEAVSQWQFEPPTSGGKPVLVVARQEFNFRPDKTVGTSPQPSSDVR
jgi:TonB family protein